MSKTTMRSIMVIAVLTAATTMGLLLGLFFKPGVTSVIAGVGVIVGGVTYLAIRFLRVQTSQVCIRAGAVRVVLQIENSPFNEANTTALVNGIVDYALRGLRTGVLPELADYRGPSTYLASPTSAVSCPAPASDARPEAKLQRPEATPASAETTAPLSAEGVRTILEACPEAAEPLRELAARQATVASPAAPAPTVVNYDDVAEAMRHDDEEDMALQQRQAGSTACELCRVTPATMQTEVFDGKNILAASACTHCAAANAAYQQSHGYPMLFKRSGKGDLVPHNAAPTPVGTT